MARSRKLKGRGVGPSKVAPAPMEEEPLPIQYEFVSEPYDENGVEVSLSTDDTAVHSVQIPNVEVTNTDGVVKLTNAGGDPFFEVKKTGDTYTITSSGTDEETVVHGLYGKKLVETLTQEALKETIDLKESTTRVGGRSRRRIKKQTRRTKRNRRTLKGKKLRKLATRRR